MFNAIFIYWLIGIAWFAVEFTSGGGAVHLAKLTRKESATLPASAIPIAAVMVSVIIIVSVVGLSFVWPYLVWDDWRKGVLFRPDRWDDKE